MIDEENILRQEIVVLQALNSIINNDNWLLLTEYENILNYDLDLFKNYANYIKWLKEFGRSNPNFNIKNTYFLDETKGAGAYFYEANDIDINLMDRTKAVQYLSNSLKVLKEMVYKQKAEALHPLSEEKNKELLERSNSKRLGTENDLQDYTAEQNITDTRDGKNLEIIEQYKTGYKELDHLIRVKPWQVNVIGAGTGTGKTTFSLNLLTKYINNNLNSGYFSFEMWKEELLKRIYSIHTWIDLGQIEQPQERGTEKREILEKTKDYYIDLQERNVINFSYNPDIQEVKTTIKKRAKMNNTKIFFIDHIGLLAGKNKKERYLEVGQNAEELKRLAEELQVTIFIITQLNRKQQESFRDPELFNISESAKIEQIASIVMLLDRDNENDPDLLKVFIKKNRNGANWEFTLKFIPTCFQIENLESN